MAEPTGLEPATSAVTGRRSNRLSYGSLEGATFVRGDRSACNPFFSFFKATRPPANAISSTSKARKIHSVTATIHVPPVLTQKTHQSDTKRLRQSHRSTRGSSQRNHHPNPRNHRLLDQLKTDPSTQNQPIILQTLSRHPSIPQHLVDRVVSSNIFPQPTERPNRIKHRCTMQTAGSLEHPLSLPQRPRDLPQRFTTNTSTRRDPIAPANRHHRIHTRLSTDPTTR